MARLGSRARTFTDEITLGQQQSFGSIASLSGGDLKTTAGEADALFPLSDGTGDMIAQDGAPLVDTDPSDIDTPAFDYGDPLRLSTGDGEWADDPGQGPMVAVASSGMDGWTSSQDASGAFGVAGSGGQPAPLDLTGPANAGRDLSIPDFTVNIADRLPTDTGVRAEHPSTLAVDQPYQDAVLAALQDPITSSQWGISAFDATSAMTAGQFDIDLIYSGPAEFQDEFDAAIARWESVITGDLPDGFLPDGTFVDDLVITATIEEIDGVGNVLGSAGPSILRGDSLLPASGQMTFDTADIMNLATDGELESVILHEMGHVLGLGTLWSLFGFVGQAGTAAEFQYTGASALAEYQALTGSLDAYIPVEADGGPGTAGGHWNEEDFGAELMTGFLDGGVANPLSRVTIGALEDLGYQVDFGQADPYALPNADPFVTLPLTPTVLEDSTGNVINSVSVGDPDGDALTVTLAATSTVTLSQVTGLTFTLGDGTADQAMTFSGSISDINAALDGLTYTPTPDQDAGGGIDITVDDGRAAPVSATLNIDIAPVNDAPTANGGTIALDEDSAIVVSAADFGFSDPVEGDALQSVTITSLPSLGTLTLNGTALTAAGLPQPVTAAELSAGALLYTAPGQAIGQQSDSFGFTVTDDGGTANGGQDTSAPSSVALNIQPVNQGPVLGGDLRLEVVEGGAIVLSAADLGAIDPDNAAIDLTYTVTSGPANGHLEFTSTPGPITSFTQDDVNQGLVRYVHDGSGSTSDTIGLAVADLGEDGALPDAGFLEVTITPDNTPPTVINPVADFTVGLGDAIVPIGLADVFDDAEDDAALTFTANGLPPGLTIENGVLAGQPGAPGTFVVTLTATDPDLASASEQVTITVDGSAFAQIVLGDETDETLTAGAGADFINGFGGNDTLIGGSGADRLEGGDGFDTASYAAAAAAVRVNLDGSVGSGAAAGDVINGVERIIGSDFDDTLMGAAMDETLEGGGGNDRLFGGDANDTLVGDAGNDTLVGGAGVDTLGGGAGQDRLFGGDGEGTLDGGDGNDTLVGDAATDTLNGGTGNDRLFGLGQADTLNGDGGNDTLVGGAGGDTLAGGAGNDRLFGEAGGDRFVFANNFGTDVIADFAALDAAEVIDLGAVTAITGFADLAANHLTQAGANAVITDGANTLTLTGVNIGELDAADFMF